MLNNGLLHLELNRLTTASISEYLSYFKANCLFSTTYPPAMWNMSSAVDYEEPRTNNGSEGGNNSLASAFSSSHPTIWVFIESLKNFHAEMELKYCQLSRGMAPNEPQRKRWRLREQDLQDYVARYNPACKQQYHRRIGLHFG